MPKSGVMIQFPRANRLFLPTIHIIYDHVKLFPFNNSKKVRTITPVGTAVKTVRSFNRRLLFYPRHKLINHVLQNRGDFIVHHWHYCHPIPCARTSADTWWLLYYDSSKEHVALLALRQESGISHYLPRNVELHDYKFIESVWWDGIIIIIILSKFE